MQYRFHLDQERTYGILFLDADNTELNVHRFHALLILNSMEIRRMSLDFVKLNSWRQRKIIFENVRSYAHGPGIPDYQDMRFGLIAV